MPASRTSAIQPDQFATFGQLLRFLRQRAGLTQRELSIAVGYSESQLSRLEQNQRAPDETALAARFVPALHLDHEPQWVARLLALGAAARAEGQPDEPAPTTKAPVSPNNLPAQLTSFIGRETELAEIQRLLSPQPGDDRPGLRLLTLTGHGGTGKTRLAQQAATALLAAFPDGAWLVELAPLMDPTLIPQTVAAVLGLKEEPDRPVLTTLIHHLRSRQTLLVLDNCEHLIQASAQFAEAVLRDCPRVCILASSRELLGVAGEHATVVPSLLTPDPKTPIALENLRTFDAVRLFVARAATAAPQFELSGVNAAAVAQVCWRLDGIPLALELAAARLRMLPVEQLAARLDDVFRLLTGGNRTALPRHQTLQALIDWSYDLLPEAERTLLRRLAVFAGGWTLEAAEAVCAGEGLEADAIARLLGRLIDKSLVLVDQHGGAARYRLMETIRQYAQAKLAASGDADEARAHHAAYFLALAEAGSPGLTVGWRQAWLDQMDLEYDNMRAALTWGELSTRGAEFALRLTGALAGFWYYRGHWREQRRWLEGALAHPQAASYPHGQAMAHLHLGRLTSMQGDFTAGQSGVAHSLQLLQELGDRAHGAWALHWLGWTARERGDATTARVHLEASLAIFRDLGDKFLVCGATNTLAETFILQGDLSRAKTLLDDNLALGRQLEDSGSIAWALNHLGQIALQQGEHEQSIRLQMESLSLFDKMGAHNEGTIWTQEGLGETALAQSEAITAATHFTEALLLAQDLGERAATSWCLAGLAGVAALNEEPERAAWLWGAAEALRQSIGVREAPAPRSTHQRLKAMAQEQIGQAAFAAQWKAGSAASPSEAIDRALLFEPDR